MLSWIGLGGSATRKTSRLGSQDTEEDYEAAKLQDDPALKTIQDNPQAMLPASTATSTQEVPEQSPPLNKMKAASAPIPSDARLVIDTLRKDLGSQRKMLEEFYSKMEPMMIQLKSVTESYNKLKSETNPDQLKSHFVSSARFAEAIADLKLEMNTCKAEVSQARSGISSARPENVAVASSMQSVMPYAQAGGNWREELHERIIELRQEFARGYVRRDEFITAMNEVREQSLKDVSSLQDALESSARKVGSLRKELQPGSISPMQALDNKASTFPSMQTALSPQRALADTTNRNKRSPKDAEVQIILYRKEGSKLGLSLDGSDGKSLMIDRIATEGDIPSWNAANPSQAVKPGDRIVAINDVRGDSGMLIDEMASSSSMKTVLMVVRQAESQSRKVIHLDEVQPRMSNNARNNERNKQLFVRLPANRDEKLGMSLKCDEDDILKIAKIVPGCVQRWNDTNPNSAVRSGDQLISVNGKSGSPTSMLEELKDGGEINLVFVRNE